MEYYPALKRREPPSHEDTRRKLKYILLSGRSQSEKSTHYMTAAIGPSGKGKTMEAVKRTVLAR